MLRHHEKYNVGVIVGRFQVHELHPGHRELLDWVHENHDTMIVFLGSSHISSRTNPIPAAARHAMIAEAYPDAIIMTIMDQRSDELWSETLDSKIREVLRPEQSVCLYGSRDGFVEHYTGTFDTEELVSEQPYWSGTEIREKISHKVLRSSDFRAGIIYAQNGDYPRVIPTVDAVVFDSADRNSVLMIRKNGETQFRFPGGYVEPGSSFMETTKREIREELGDMEVHLEYLGDTEIDDWRMGFRDKIHTTVFIGHKLWGQVGNFTDKLEIAEVKPFTLTNLRLGYEKSIVPEHHVIVEMLLEHLDKQEVNAEEFVGE